MKGYLAFIDILGFKEIILRGDQNKIFDVIENILKKSTHHNPRIEYLLFSDTIILTLPGISVSNRDSIFSACSNLFFDLTVNKVPVRGCISCGDYENKKVGESRIIFGKALIEAFTLEQIQNWIGILISSKIIGDKFKLIKKMQNITCSPHVTISDKGKELMYRKNFAWQKNFCFYNKIPIHSNDKIRNDYIEGFVLSPVGSDVRNPAELISGLSAFLEALIGLKLKSQDSKNQNKYQESINWVTSLLGNWQSYRNDDLNKYLK